MLATRLFLFCVIVAVAMACSSSTVHEPQKPEICKDKKGKICKDKKGKACTTDSQEDECRKCCPPQKRSVGCNPGALIVEFVTKLPFGTSEINKDITRMIRAKILKLTGDKSIQFGKYDEFDVTETSSNGFLMVQYTFGDSVRSCGDFKHFAQAGFNEITEINNVIVTCGCEKPVVF